MATSDIEWTDLVWNVTRGCRRISAGCGGAKGEGGCYAERQAYRYSGPGQAYEGLVKLTASGPRWTGEGRFVAHKLAEPLSWREPKRVFVDSMSDLFFEAFTNEQIAAVFGVMAACPQHTFQVLTKRPKRMREWFAWVAAQPNESTRWHPAALECSRRAFDHLEWDGRLVDALTLTWPMSNVWLGVSVENQAAADERIPDLRETPAAVRFLSIEPMLGPVWIPEALKRNSQAPAVWLPPIDLVIAGCESGPGARPCEVAWLRALRDQCAAAGVPFFLKQGKNPLHTLDGVTDREDLITIGRGSKRKPGGVIGLPYLDGVQHTAMPGAAR